MSHLIVIAFDSQGEAEQVHQALVNARKSGLLAIRDTAVVRKDANGKVHVDNQVSSGTWAATGVGGALGLLLGSVFFPVAGIALGMAGGALVGRLMHLGVDGKFVKEVQEQIAPDSSALFVVTDNENLAAELAILRQHHGKVLQTNLPDDMEESLREALGDK
jgi:uncharacterized membrane protein